MSKFHIRTTPTSSKATAVQVVEYINRKMTLSKHIGSAHNEEQLKKLKIAASEWIEKTTKQETLFPKELISLDKQYRYIGFRYGFIYETLKQLCVHLGFHYLRNDLLLDLVIARIIEPGSKVKSISFLKEFIGIEHHREYFYRQIPELVNLQKKVESKVLKIAAKEFKFDFSFIFYDVTTLYFESNDSDDLRQCGFSKDNKFNQPQIVLGLLVSNEGFPIGYQIFEGSKFEGHTLIPVIKKFKKKHKIKTFNVVADAAMISIDNVKALRAAKLNYIVGARVANLPLNSIKLIHAAISGNDGQTMRLQTDCGDLVCEFSRKRYAKDKREMEKYIDKAEKLLKNPGKIKHVKFIKQHDQKYTLNTALIEKNNLLLGIKGYYTNLPSSEASDKFIIEHYHNLWRVEQNFRISKSDLQIRPIYHFRQKMIEVHILICFMSLAVCKYIELKTGKSIQAVLKLFKGITDARLVDIASREEITLRSEINEEVKLIINKVSISA